jgi:hypothetical protein
VINRYDWTSLLSLSEVALSRTTAWLALSLTDESSAYDEEKSPNEQEMKKRSQVRELIVSCDIPFPFDHFFFCFLPADAAAGACTRKSVESYPGVHSGRRPTILMLRRCKGRKVIWFYPSSLDVVDQIRRCADAKQM